MSLGRSSDFKYNAQGLISGLKHSVISGTATLDFPSISANTISTLTVTVTGAVVGDSVSLAPPSGINAGLMWSGFVSAANTVTIRLLNTTGSAIDPASATWKVNVIRS